MVKSKRRSQNETGAQYLFAYKFTSLLGICLSVTYLLTYALIHLLRIHIFWLLYCTYWLNNLSVYCVICLRTRFVVYGCLRYLSTYVCIYVLAWVTYLYVTDLFIILKLLTSLVIKLPIGIIYVRTNIYIYLIYLRTCLHTYLLG